MKKSSLCLGIAAVVLFSSCNLAGGLTVRWRLKSSSLPLEKAREDASLSAESRRLIELAEDILAFSASHYNLGEEASQFRFIKDNRSALSYKLTIAAPRSIVAESVSYYLDEDSALRASARAKDKGKVVLIEPFATALGFGYAPSPLYASLATLPRERLTEWINFELFSAAFAKSGDKSLRDSFPAFAAEMATREYLAARFTAASPLLGEYVSEKRDERTFALLFEDFRSRIQTLYAQNPLPADWESLRAKLEESWVRDFRTNYPNRFITNGFSGFGTSPVTDVSIAARLPGPSGWSDWEKRYRAAGEDLAKLLAETSRR